MWQQAEDAYQAASSALLKRRFGEAIGHLTTSLELNPGDVKVRECVHGWCVFTVDLGGVKVLARSCVHPRTRARTHPLTHSLARSLTHSLSNRRTHSLAHSLTVALTRSL